MAVTKVYFGSFFESDSEIPPPFKGRITAFLNADKQKITDQDDASEFDFDAEYFAFTPDADQHPRYAHTSREILHLRRYEFVRFLFIQ